MRRSCSLFRFAALVIVLAGCVAPDDETTAARYEYGDGGGSGTGSGSGSGSGSDAPPDAAPDAPADAAPDAPADAAADAGTDAPVDAPADAPVDAGCVAQDEPECPDAPDGMEPVDPGIASGSLCRGACGPDCPTTCRSGTPVTECLEWQTADCRWHAKVCTYPVRECGSHAGCRDHDDCYDDCATALFPFGCRRICDKKCSDDYDAGTCLGWANGNGPYDSWISYAGEPTSYSYDSTCY